MAARRICETLIRWCGGTHDLVAGDQDLGIGVEATLDLDHVRVRGKGIVGDGDLTEAPMGGGDGILVTDPRAADDVDKVVVNLPLPSRVGIRWCARLVTVLVMLVDGPTGGHGE